MPQKRKRRISTPGQGLVPGGKSRRSTPAGNHCRPWDWVGSEVVDITGITPEHRLVACGLSTRNGHPFCSNQYEIGLLAIDAQQVIDVDELDIIVIDDEPPPLCSPKECKSNPNCLNYVGQDQWEKEEKAVRSFLKATKFEDDPALDTRQPGIPVGLRNLGATCYANAFIQVWYRNLPFRDGVYACQLSDENPADDSPIFQLQVTFAALQEGIRKVYDPSDLVKSLKLPTSEQQDAQEFSKLFISHLDAEFRKQDDPVLKSLITDQFQGRYVFTTRCRHCQYQSETSCDFLEMEINFEGNAHLEDRIKASLEPEILAGENRYFCGQCSTLQEATRTTRIQSLPPVLHFSLLRFIYDVSTMARKKLKHTISFPEVLDMGQYMCANDGAGDSSEAQIYELRGVLLHKGLSAYHGHYEAQVFDITTRNWYQFSDEAVMPIDFSKLNKAKDVSKTEDPQRKNKRNGPSYRGESDNGTERNSVVSKDAYMLIYARRGIEFCGKLAPGDPRSNVNIIPLRAEKIVDQLNTAHADACKAYEERKNKCHASFEKRREMIMKIYREWNVSSTNEDCQIVSRQALTTWLRDCFVFSEMNDQRDAAHDAALRSISLSDILCCHQRLDPTRANDFKRIKQQAVHQIEVKTGYVFEPRLKPDDVCAECIMAQFKDRLYQIEHPRLVAEFDQLPRADLRSRGFWISTTWLKDWRMSKPKMHTISQDDPAPGAENYLDDVICEHERLTVNLRNRRRISAEETAFLKILYPSWQPPSTDEEPCPICTTRSCVSGEEKKRLRKQADDEKSKLLDMYDNRLSVQSLSDDTQAYAIIPPEFFDSWKQWIDRPAEHKRPDSVATRSLLCEHNHLVIDPNCVSDFESFFVIVKRSDWDTLESYYPGSPLIDVEVSAPTENDMPHKVSHRIPVCDSCRIRRRTDWITTDLTVRRRDLQIALTGKTAYRTYARQSSRRLRGRKRDVSMKLQVSKSTTVKDVKVMLQDEHQIPTIHQKLFHHGKELDDNEATIESLNIFARDILELEQLAEDLDLHSDSEVEGAGWMREGLAFSGTVLVGSTASVVKAVNDDIRKACSACTFLNDDAAHICEMCGGRFT